MPKQEYVEPKVVQSVKDIQFDGAEQKLDLEEDAWSYGAPPPWGGYRVKIFLDKDGIATGLEDQNDDKTVYVQFKLLCKIVDGDYEGVPVYTRVNTRIYRGKNISTVAGLILKLGYQIKNPITPKKLARMLEELLKTEPILEAEVDWRGSYVYQDKAGKDQYENVYRSYKEFPDDPENPGMKKHSVIVTNKHTGGTAEVRAMTNVVRFFGKAEHFAPPTKGNSHAAAVQQAVVPDLDLEPVTISKVVIHEQPKTVDSDDDFSLILAQQ